MIGSVTMDFKTNLNLYLKARYPIIYISTYEEQRLINDIINVAKAMNPKRNVRVWDYVNGYGIDSATKKEPLSAFSPILKEDRGKPTIYILKDYHKFIDTSTVSRYLRNITEILSIENKTIIILSPSLNIPVELQEDIEILDYELPSYKDIDEYINSLFQDNVPIELNESSKEMLISACQGLTLNKIKLILQKAIIMNGKITSNDIELVLEEKKQIIKKTEILDFYSTNENLEDIGGLNNFKNWIKTRGLAFTDKAIRFGLPYPKGVLLVGIQGTGKSLSAKAISKQWKMPLLKLDVGRLMGSYVGESEERTRHMIKISEAMAPCILWIDEIDKGFSGALNSNADSGTSARVFGTLITWMQEKKSPVFIVATANNISNLPPELMRKGRFDEIFFVDLPDFSERSEIFKLHLKRRRYTEVRNFDIDLLSKLTDGYSGAEIEQIIIDAMFEAFSKSRDFNTEDIIDSIKRIISLSQTYMEEIKSLKAWAESGRARKASI